MSSSSTLMSNPNYRPKLSPLLVAVVLSPCEDSSFWAWKGCIPLGKAASSPKPVFSPLIHSTWKVVYFKLDISHRCCPEELTAVLCLQAKLLTPSSPGSLWGLYTPSQHSITVFFSFFINNAQKTKELEKATYFHNLVGCWVFFCFFFG